MTYKQLERILLSSDIYDDDQEEILNYVAELESELRRAEDRMQEAVNYLHQ